MIKCEKKKSNTTIKETVGNSPTWRIAKSGAIDACCLVGITIIVETARRDPISMQLVIIPGANVTPMVLVEVSQPIVHVHIILV